MARIKRRWGVLAGVVAAASTFGVVGSATPAFAAGYSSSMAGSFVAAINGLRASHGLRSLSVNSSLISMADYWSAHLAAAGTLSHNPGLASQAPAGWQMLGENVGVGPSVSALQAAFTASPEHYANMVNPAFNSIGVAVYVSSQGYLWVTEDYMEAPVAAVRTSSTPSSPAPAPVLRVTVRPTPAPAPVYHPAAPAPAPVRHQLVAAAASTPVTVPAQPAATPPAPAPAPAPAVPVSVESAVAAASHAAPTAQNADRPLVAVPTAATQAAPARHRSAGGDLTGPALLVLALAVPILWAERRRLGLSGRGRATALGV